MNTNSSDAVGEAGEQATLKGSTMVKEISSKAFAIMMMMMRILMMKMTTMMTMTRKRRGRKRTAHTKENGALAFNSLPMNIKTLSPKDRFPAISAFYS